MKNISIVLIVVSHCLFIHSQGEMIEKGDNGIFSGVNYTFSDEAEGWGGSLGFSYKGIIDLSFGYSKSTLKNNTEFSHLKWNSTQYALAIHFLKGDLDSFFVGFSLSLSYSNLNFQTDNWVFNPNTQEWIDEEMTVNGNSILPAMQLYLSGGLGNTFILQCFLSAGLSMTSADHSKIKTESGILAFGLGISLGYSPLPAIKINLSPAVGIIEDENSFGVNLGLIVLTNNL